MKKSSLLKMKYLPATEEMLAVAREDVPVKVGSGWNTFYRCRYSGFVRSAVEGGILKVTLYDPDAMRLGGTLPVYEIFMEKEKQQFLTYDRTRNEWRAAKIDYLLETRVIDGRKYLTIPVEEEIEVNGFGVRTRGEKQG